MKKKFMKLSLTAIMLVALTTAFTGCEFKEGFKSLSNSISSTDYYVKTGKDFKKIDGSGDRDYQYTFKGYDKKGNEKELKLEVSKELREEAFLKVNLKEDGSPQRWEEVAETDLPDKAKEKLK